MGPLRPVLSTRRASVQAPLWKLHLTDDGYLLSLSAGHAGSGSGGYGEHAASVSETTARLGCARPTSLPSRGSMSLQWFTTPGTFLSIQRSEDTYRIGVKRSKELKRWY